MSGNDSCLKLCSMVNLILEFGLSYANYVRYLMDISKIWNSHLDIFSMIL